MKTHSQSNKYGVREERRAHGSTELARRLGYSVGHMSQVLRGERLASKALAADLRRLGVRVRAGVKPGAPRKGGAE